MADIVWQGTGGVAGKIDDNANWVGGVAPGGSDNAIFSAGNADATNGTFPDVSNVFTTTGWKGNFGTASTPLTIGSCTKFLWAGGGAICNVSVAGAKTVATMVLMGSTCTIAGTGTVTTLYVANANVYVTVTACTNFYGQTAGSYVNFATSGTAITAGESYGTWICEARTITAGEINGPNGKLYTRSTTATTSLKVKGGATYYKHSSGTDTAVTLTGKNSMLTPVGSPFYSSTITTLNIHTGGIFIASNGSYSFTLTNPINYFGQQAGPES